MMRFADKRLTVITGCYGCGKTELSINVARHMKSIEKCQTVLVDMDIVNPYLKSSERKMLLLNEGIRVIASPHAISTVDSPALSAQIQGVFDKQDEHVIMDVGGEDSGAVVLGCYAGMFARERSNTRCLFVINCMRPLTRTKGDILRLMQRIVHRSRLDLTGLVNNTNLSAETQTDMLLWGQDVVEDVSRESGVPQVLITGQKEVLANMPEKYHSLCFPINRVMRLEWMEK